MSHLSEARAAITAKGAAVAGVTKAYPRLPDTILGPMSLVLGQMTWTTIPGDRERTTYNFELWLYVAWENSDDATIASADDMIELLQAAYSQGITLGQPARTQECDIVGGSANDWVTIDGAVWLTVRLMLQLKATFARGYTA